MSNVKTKQRVDCKINYKFTSEAFNKIKLQYKTGKIIFLACISTINIELQKIFN